MSNFKCSTSNFGYCLKEDSILFRLYAPNVLSAEAVIFDHYEDSEGVQIPLQKNDEGVWEGSLCGDHIGKWYVYQLQHPEESQDPLLKFPVADPWSEFVTTRNHYLQFPKTKIIAHTPFDWEDDDFVTPVDPRDLIIYEAHIKDLVAHPSAKTKVRGIYNDFCDAEVGGISHLKKLGVNAVEFLPLQKFAYFEPPYNELTAEGVKNTWNPYSRNYWGYMTSFFLAPETIYASDASFEANEIIGRNEQCAIQELKGVIKDLHKEGITVIMDVVYNHASHYDLNPLKQTAKEHYFKLDGQGNYINDSWTGNDIQTSSFYSRKIIVESVKYWMREYHIDGFRFDLAGLLDWETVDLIRHEAQKINPNVLLIAEPWGGRYAPMEYSQHDWPSWNDRLRNSYKGFDPLHDKGLIFGKIKAELNRHSIENFIRGTLESDDHGLYSSSKHSVNYLESHDGYTLGDYIRIALDPAKADQSHVKCEITKLSAAELKIAKLAAFTLFVSQGITMVHAGQEWARSKVISAPAELDPNSGKLDHDSYNKDDATNWINFDEISINSELFDYYKGLIQLRLCSPALRKAMPDEIIFKVYKDPLHFTFSINGDSSNDKYDYFISLNANTHRSNKIIIPVGYWEMVANADQAGENTFKSIRDSYSLAPSTGIILRKLRIT